MNDDLYDILEEIIVRNEITKNSNRFLSNFRVQKTMRSITRNIEKGEIEEEMVES